MKYMNINTQETHRTPRKIKKRPIPKHIIIKLSKGKNKERILKAAGEKPIITYKGYLIRK